MPTTPQTTGTETGRHTPGPYFVRECTEWNNPYGYVGVHGPDSKCCFHSNGGPGHESLCESVADRMNQAYLAGFTAANAAAPDLLAACKLIVEAHPLNGNANCGECKASRAAEAAIAKAEGQVPS